MKTKYFLLLIALLLSFGVTGQTYNYAEALQKSLYFYDAEKSGPGIDGGRLPWRGNSELCDVYLPLTNTMTNMSQSFIDANKSVLDPDNNGFLDVSGGFHDAGDHVKFGLPQTYSSSTLEWALYEFKSSFTQIGELEHMKEELRWFSDYFLRSTFMNSSGAVVAFCYQVGEGNKDHLIWSPPELLDSTIIKRPGYFATSETPASDQCAGASASLTLSYLNNVTDDPAYAAKCLSTAKALYDFAVKYRGIGYDGGFYTSSYDADELSWAAVWLYTATGDSKYLNDIISKDANGMYTGWLSKIIRSTADNWQNMWVHSWDTKWAGVFARLAELTDDSFYWYIFKWNLEYWSGVTHENPADGGYLTKSPAGFSVISSWGSARYNAAEQFTAMVYKKYTGSTIFDDWTISQMHYIMGNNPLSRSYIVGYGNSAKHPHHRAAHGSPNNDMSNPAEHKHILYGALVGGPGTSDEHNDIITDYAYNEVAIDYNAGLVGALAGLYTYFGEGQSPIANFYPKDSALVEYGLKGKMEQDDDQSSQITIRISNEAAYPPRKNVSFMSRYFFDISELNQYNQTIADVTFSKNYDENSMKGDPVVATGPLVWDAANNIYYMEFQWPAAGFYGTRDYQFRLASGVDPVYYKFHWDPTNDYSHIGLSTTELAPTTNIPLYADGILVSGVEPPGGTKVSVTGVTVSPTATTISIGSTTKLTATVVPTNASNKVVSWSSSNTAVATVSSAGVINGVAAGSAIITTTTSDGSFKATSTITVTNIPVTGVSVIPTSVTAGIGSTTTLIATVTPTNATNKSVSWSSSNTSVATVSSVGIVTCLAAGTAIITARTASGGYTATCNITVTTIAVTGVSVLPANASIIVGGTTTLTASVLPTNATNKSVSWSSGNISVATVSSTGVVTGVAEGNAIITITTNDGSYTATSTITVSNTVLPCTNPVSVNLPLTQNGAGEYCWSTSGTITSVNSWNLDLLEVNSVDFTNTWSSSMPARINGNYYIHYKASVAWAHLEVAGSSSSVSVTGVSVSPTSASLTVGGTTSLTATVAPANATNKSVTWSSSNTAVASISTAGVVTGAGTGSATITVTTVDQAKTATATITVSSSGTSVTGVTVAPTSASITIGGTTSLTATVSPTNATNKNVAWSSSNTAVASVSTAGVVTGIGTGSATITVTTVDQSKTATVAITVSSSSTSVTGVTVAPTTASITVGGTTSLTATVSPTNATNKSVTWSSSNTAIATVSTAGVVTGVGTGNATITVKTTDQSKTATATITVTSSSVSVTGVTVSPASATVNVGSTTTLTATVAPTNATNKSVAWSSSNTAIAAVSTTGVVTGVGTGSATITVTTADQSKIATAAITVTSTSTTTCGSSNAVSITIPFSKDGAGEYCYVTTQAMAYVNSWNTDKVTINDVDFTNKWSNSMPAAINGAWYIYYKASVTWAHFEAPSVKSAMGINSEIANEILVYPNPVNTTLYLRGIEGVKEIRILDLSGKSTFQSENNLSETEIDVSFFKKGVYIIQMSGDNILERRIITVN